MHAWPEEERALRALVAQMDDLQEDAAGFAALFAPDGELVNAVGRRVAGRASIQDALAQALRTPLAGARTRYDVERVRRLRGDVALVTGTKTMLAEGSPHAAPGSVVAFSLVATKIEGAWRIALAHNTLVRA